MAFSPLCGFQRLTASGVVSDSGKPIIICGYTVEGGAGGATSPFVRNGTAVGSATAFALDTTAAASTNLHRDLATPVVLASGAYVSFDSNTTAVTMFFRLSSVTS